MIRSGDRREIVRFLSRALDADGQPLGAYSERLKAAAGVRVLRGTEAVMQARLGGVQPIEVTVLASASARTITTAWRILWKGSEYAITAAAPEVDGEIIILAQSGDES